MVVHAFAAGDSDALKSLMSPEAFANFESAIHARADAGHTMSTTVVSIDDATIVGAGSSAPMAQLRVRFAAKLASVTRDAAGRGRRRIAQHGRRSYRPVDIRARCPFARSQLAADGDRIRELRRGRNASPCGLSLSQSISAASLAGARTIIWRRSAPSSARRRRLTAGQTSPRPARPAPPELVANARASLCADVTAEREARRFFETRFRPFRVVRQNGAGFLTGYYEPCVPASKVESEEFRWPILARPADLVTFGPETAPAGFPAGVSGARRLGDGSLVPYDDRAAIEAERRDPIVWVRDAVEAFLIQVQGSAQVEFPDRRRARLAYDGRNGLPYTSIGRLSDRGGRDRRRRHVACGA